MPRMLHLADLHLGWRPRRLDEERARTRRARRDRLLAEAVDVALREEVDAVVVAGDLFETFDPEAAVVEEALTQLGRLGRAGVVLVAVPGNHDELTYGGSVYRRLADRWPGTLVTSPMPTRIGTFPLGGVDVTFHGLAYVGGVTDVAGIGAALTPADGGGIHVFVAHGTLSGVAGALPGRSLPIGRAELAAAGYDYAALGHIHVPGRHAIGRGLAVYPGCVGGKGLDDLGSTSWTIVELEEGVAPRLHEVPAEVQPLRVVRLDLTAFEEPEGVAAAVLEHADPDALVRVELTGALPFVIDLPGLEARARAGFFHLEVRDATVRVSDALLDAWARGRSVTGAFVRRMRARLDAAADDDERRTLTRALLYGVRALQEAA